MSRILIIGGNARSLVDFRGDMIQNMVELGHEVIAMAPEVNLEGILTLAVASKVSVKMKDLGARFLPFPLSRTGIKPLRDLHTLYLLTRKMLELKPDVVLSYTIKPVIYGSWAARIAGVNNIFSMITGLGNAFNGETLKQKLLEKIVTRLYRMALCHNKKVYFMNPDDLKLFSDRKILPEPGKAVLINGSGVNTDYFTYARARTDKIVFLLAARLLWSKGIGEFVEAARILKKEYPDASWRIVGPYDNTPSAVQRSDIKEWQEEGIIEYMGATEDVRPYIDQSSVYVLPSYREGTPRSVLEAMSMGRPIITTDAPGCRETVIEAVNGYLVPVGGSVSLAKAMEKFLQNHALIANMGAKSRKIARERFDVKKVNDTILQAMDLTGTKGIRTVPLWEPVNDAAYFVRDRQDQLFSE